MEMHRNTLVAKRIARWGRRVGLAYSVRGWLLGPGRSDSGADFQQILSGDDGVEKAVALDAAVKVAEVDEYGPDGHVVTDVQSLHFARDLFLDFAPDFVLALRFDDVCRAGRLDQEIDLTAAAARVALVAIGSRRDDDAVAKVQVGENLPEMVDDQVLELKTHRRMPVRQRFQGCESVGSVFDFHGMGFNVLEIKPRVVVADAVSADAGALSGRWVDAAFRRDETCERKGVQLFGEVSVVVALEALGQLFSRLRAFGELNEDIPLEGCLLAEDGGEDFVEILEERTAWGEAKTVDVFGGRKSRVKFFKVAGNAACHGKEVEDLAGGKAVGSRSPELHGFGERQFVEDIITREPSDESGRVEYILLDPGVDASAKDENELVVSAEHRIPGRLEVAGKVGVVTAHPRNLVHEDHGAASVVNGLVQKFEGLGPVVWRGDRTTGGLFESDGEGLQLPPVGHVWAWRKSDKFQVGTACALGEFANQAALADSTSSATRDKRGRALAPKCSKVFEFGFSSKEHIFLPSCMGRSISYSGVKMQYGIFAPSNRPGEIGSRLNFKEVA